MRVLYLSYDGALDPLGRSQVLPYLEALAHRGHLYSLITYEKPGLWDDLEVRSAMRDRLTAAGIDWHPLPYHRSPPVVSTGRDLLAGTRLARRLLENTRFDLVHVRSYPCAVIARELRRLHGVPFLFDMRGFYAEERVDGGLWSTDGPLYQLTKRLEATFLRDASAIVTLTHASLPVLDGWMARAGASRPVFVVPTAVDLERFPLGSDPDPAHLVYVGSVGTWYMVSEMVDLSWSFLSSRPDARVTFLINGDPEALRDSVASHEDQTRFDVRSVPHDQVAAELRHATATVALIRPAPSKIASSPTKVAESLASGAPVLVNRGVGDVADLVTREGVGVVLDPTRPGSYAAALDELMALTASPGIRERCRRVAEAEYSLEGAADVYEAAYRVTAGVGLDGGLT